MRRPPEDRSIVPFPNHAVSNMEWVPTGITEKQKLAERLVAELLKALGPRNILWGTDSIWWGSPQWLIDAFKALTIPEQMQEQFGYPPLTEKTKRLILGLNSARLYGVKPKAERCTLASSPLAEFQGEQGGSRAGRALVARGPTTRREFFALLRAEKRAQLG